MEHDQPTCSFCDKTKDEVGKLVPGRAGVYICGGCTEESSRALLEPSDSYGHIFQRSMQSSACCIFCGRDQRQVWQLLTGYGVNVCSRCIEIANVILGDDDAANEIHRPRAAELNSLNKAYSWDVSSGRWFISVESGFLSKFAKLFAR